jgi:peptidylprolyl isomerase
MSKKIILIALITLGLLSCNDKHGNLKDGLYANIKTSKGDLIVQLEYEKTPITVANFVSLAEGKNTFVSDNLRNKPFYNGLKFHRVIPEFMIQGGDPLGNGSGDGGYKFKDEFTDLKFDNGGILAMANSGPGTNGTQFFITHVETSWLNGKHTIFGHVVGNGIATVNKILQDDTIISVEIIRKGEKAKKFDAVKTFSNYFSNESENIKKQAANQAAIQKLYDEKYAPILKKQIAIIENLKTSGTKTKSGLIYKITKKGNDKKQIAGSIVFINYAGFFENGNLFDSCVEDVSKTFGKFNESRASQNGYQPLQFEAGRKEGMIPGFLEALESMTYGEKKLVFIPYNLAYGPAGTGDGLIPPNSNLIFEIELKSAQ